MSTRTVSSCPCDHVFWGVRCAHPSHRAMYDHECSARAQARLQNVPAVVGPHPAATACAHAHDLLIERIAHDHLAACYIGRGLEYTEHCKCGAFCSHVVCWAAGQQQLGPTGATLAMEKLHSHGHGAHPPTCLPPAWRLRSPLPDTFCLSFISLLIRLWLTCLMSALDTVMVHEVYDQPSNRALMSMYHPAPGSPNYVPPSNNSNNTRFQDQGRSTTLYVPIES